MVKKVLNTLTHNLIYKILAVVLACILWLVVYNLDDPNVTKTFTTNVTVVNGDVVTEMNKCYEILEGSNTITFRVTGQRSYLDQLEDTNFSATADMNNMVIGEDQTTATIPIKISSSVYNRYLTFAGGTKYLKVSLENMVSKRFVVAANTYGEVAEGCALGDVSITNPNVITVSGPVSIVNTIDKIVATIDIEGMSTNLSDDVVPVFYDEDGAEVDTTRLTLSNRTVTITAKILTTKEVPLEFHVSGTPKNAYDVTGVLSSPEKIVVKGTAAVLNPLISIDIPEGVLNVDGADANIETTIDITEYLPEGVELVDSDQRTINVTINIEGHTSKQLIIPSENIEIIGVSGNMEALIGQANIVVTASGRASVLQKLEGERLTGRVDVTGLGEGTHSLKLQIDQVDGYTVAEKYVDVILSQKTEDITNMEGSIDDGNTVDNGNTADEGNASGADDENRGDGEPDSDGNAEKNTN